MKRYRQQQFSLPSARNRRIVITSSCFPQKVSSHSEILFGATSSCQACPPVFREAARSRRRRSMAKNFDYKNLRCDSNMHSELMRWILRRVPHAELLACVHHNLRTKDAMCVFQLWPNQAKFSYEYSFSALEAFLLWSAYSSNVSSETMTANPPLCLSKTICGSTLEKFENVHFAKM